MIVLAVDSTENVAAAAITEDERLIGEYVLNCKNTHSETLLPMVESLMKSARIKPDDIDLFACSAGPGSFTGVRIGVSLIKGLAFGRGKPCMGVSSLEALAYNFRGLDGIVCPVLDARRGQLYNALFSIADGKVQRLKPDRVILADELADELREISLPVSFCGSGAAIAAAACPDVAIQYDSAALKLQRGYSVALCAYRRYSEFPEEVLTDTQLSPTYLRSGSPS